MGDLAIVIAAEARFDRIDRCLSSLVGADETIVVHTGGPQLTDRIARAHPQARLIDGAGLSKPARRARGMSAAEASFVAMVHENYVLSARWLSEARAARQGVVSGEVAAAPGAGFAAQACFLWEYAHVTPPLNPGPLTADEAALIPSGNVVYDANQVRPEDFEGSRSELEYHAAIYARGVRFERNPRMQALYPLPTFVEFVHERYGWSLDWVSRHADQMSSSQRFVAGAGRWLLAPLLLARFARRMISRPRLWAFCLAASPLFVVLALTQALAEIRAYWKL